jgi:hypothetical protein
MRERGRQKECQQSTCAAAVQTALGLPSLRSLRGDVNCCCTRGRAGIQRSTAWPSDQRWQGRWRATRTGQTFESSSLDQRIPHTFECVVNEESNVSLSRMINERREQCEFELGVIEVKSAL